MGFDRDAFLSLPTGGSSVAQDDRVAPGFDRDAFLSIPSAPKKEEPGMAEAALRGIKQGATLGFGDEITGALESMFTGKNYRQARDEARANDAAARNAHSTAFTLGELGGGAATALVPGLNVAKGASVAGAALRAGGIGAAAGLGGSEADLTRGDVGGAARDTLIGGAVGGALGGAGQKLANVIGNAPERVAERTFEDVTRGGKPSVIQRLRAKSGDVSDVASEFGVAGEGQAAASKAAMGGLKKETRAIHEITDETIGGARPVDVRNVLKSQLERYSDPADADKARVVKRLIRDIDDKWHGHRAEISSEDIRAYATKMGSKGFAGGPLGDSPIKQTYRDTASAVTEMLKQRVANAEAADPALAGQTARLGELNQKISILSDLKKVGDRRAVMANRGEDTGVIGDLLHSHSAYQAATKLGKRAVGVATEPADRMLAALVTRWRAGDTSVVPQIRAMVERGATMTAAPEFVPAAAY